MNRAGYTLTELVIVLTLLSVLLAVAAPPLARWRDAWAVRAARDDLAAALAWTRMAAASHGGAVLRIDGPEATYATSVATGGSGPAADLRSRYGVRLEGVEAVEIRYDRLGIGRLANRTIELRRGSARAGVTVSAYGRVRRW